jgi:hypothetical protein
MSESFDWKTDEPLPSNDLFGLDSFFADRFDDQHPDYDKLLGVRACEHCQGPVDRLMSKGSFYSAVPTKNHTRGDTIRFECRDCGAHSIGSCDSLMQLRK